MSISNSRFLGTLLSVVLLSLACTEAPEPTRRVQLPGGGLDMLISEQWTLEESSDEARVYIHAEIQDLRLHFLNSTDEFGSPLKVGQIKSLLGQELNREFNGVSARVSMGGNALLKYRRVVDGENGDEILSEEWVIAKPVGHGDIARVDISLHIPRSAEANPAIPGVVETIDRRVGDAKIPRV